MSKGTIHRDCDIDELKSFGLRLRDRRQQVGHTLRSLSRECGRSIGFLCDMENGRREPGSTTLARLADVLGVTMHELWHGVGRCDPASEE